MFLVPFLLNLPFSTCIVCAILGPFSNQEMAEWFQAGYFTMSLLVKRACDESFQPLGDIMKMWGRVPFTPGPAPPPQMVSVQESHKSNKGFLTNVFFA